MLLDEYKMQNNDFSCNQNAFVQRSAKALKALTKNLYASKPQTTVANSLAINTHDTRNVDIVAREITGRAQQNQ